MKLRQGIGSSGGERRWEEEKGGERRVEVGRGDGRRREKVGGERRRRRRKEEEEGEGACRMGTFGCGHHRLDPGLSPPPQQCLCA